MKRLSIFFAAIMMAACVQMANATIVYELNGGTQSAYLTAQDMYHDLNMDWNTFKGVETVWKPLAEMAQGGDGAAGLPTSAGPMDLSFFQNEAVAAKWQWLVDYLAATCAAQGKTDPSAAGNAAFLRYNISSFFVNGVRPSWPASADYTACGVAAVDAYQPYWKSGFANPTDPTEQVTLNNPYMEGFTFDGWYASADFSGDRVLTVDASTTGTLYAKYVAYIPTCAEIAALEDNAATNAKGVVTYINGKNVYIQDATGGMLLYMKANPTFKVADEVVVSGTKVMYGGAPEVKDVVEVSAVAAALPNAQTLTTLSQVITDYSKYLFQLVHFDGLRVAKYDDKGNVFVRDDNDTLQCYKMTPDQAAFPVGKKVNLTAIVGYYNKVQFVGDVAGLEAVANAPADGQTYEDMIIMDEQGVGQTYSLVSNWLYSTNLGNYKAAKPDAIALGSRGMAVKDGIMYFPYHNDALGATEVKLVRVDAATGEMLDPLVPEMKEGDLLLNGKICSGAFNDLKVDNAGNLVTLTLITSGGAFRIWSIDEKTGAMHTLVDLTAAPDTVVSPETGDTTLVGGFLKNIFPDAPAIRLDRIGVLGDVTKDAVLMSVTNGVEVYYWYIVDGKWDGETHQIICNPGEGVSFSTGPDIQPIEGDMFYVDGFNTNPMLFDYDGALLDGFIGDAAGMAPLHTGHNGIYEFELNGDYFMVCAYNNTVGERPSSFCMYKCKDENRIFAEMTQMWVFPANGMGEASNGGRVATALVLADNENKMADMYVYTGENGYGKYSFFSTKEPVVEGVESVKAANAGVEKMIENGNLIIRKNGVRYNAIGAQL